MYIQPPATFSAVFGACSSWSCTTVSFEIPPSCSSISQVTRLGSSAAVVSSCSAQARVLQHPQVLHHAEARHLQLGLELGQRAAVTLEQPVEQEATRRVGECLEDRVVVHARMICDQTVTCQGSSSCNASRYAP